MKKTYIITDTHINHKMLVLKGYRPENFTELIIKNCRKILKPTDDLIHGGDVIFSNASSLSQILNLIPGYKILIRGNHDKKTTKWYLEHGFHEVHDMLFKTFIHNEKNVPILFSHKPYNFQGKDILNIHGHFHTYDREPEVDENEFDSRKKESYPFYSDNHLLLSLEEMNYQPIQLKEFLISKEKIK